MPEGSRGAVAVSVDATADDEDGRYEVCGYGYQPGAIGIGNPHRYQPPGFCESEFPHIPLPGHQQAKGACGEDHDHRPDGGVDAQSTEFHFPPPEGDIGEEGYADPARIETEGPPDEDDHPWGRVG